MKTSLRLLLPFFIVLWCAPPALSQPARGIVKEGLTIQSARLGKAVRYSVYLPADYETSNRLYPVVYLLHGYTDNDTGWLQFGEANRIADDLIASGDIPPMILVMPDAGVSWYVDNFDGSVPYESFFIEELIPMIERTYRARPEKQFRGVAGLSMGGFGTLVYSMRHPDLFAAGAALSAAVWTRDQLLDMPQEQWEQWAKPVYGPGLQGKERLTPHLLSYNAIEITNTADPEQLRKVRLYIDCGDDDFLTVGNAALHIALTEREIPHEYRSRDGRHTWSYWRTGLPDALRFIGESFRR